jgi:hypothetical protein
MKVGADEPPAGLSRLRQALWSDAKGNRERAHNLVATDKGGVAARVHAKLHRKERHLGNPQYWYTRAGTAVFEGSSQKEWELLDATIADQAASVSASCA